MSQSPERTPEMKEPETVAADPGPYENWTCREYNKRSEIVNITNQGGFR